MKMLLSIIALVLLTFPTLNAQDESAPGGIPFGKGDRLIINIFDDLWQGAPDKMSVNPYSPGFDSYFMRSVPFGKSSFAFSFGTGIGVHNMRSNAIPVVDSGGITVFSRIPDSVNNNKTEYTNNKLSLAYLDIPLELRFKKENQKGKAFKISAGVKLGYLMSGHTKYAGTDYTGSTGDIKIKKYKINNLEPLRYGAIFRIGFSYYNIYGYYSLSRIFKKDKGPEMYPVSLGVCATPF